MRKPSRRSLGRLRIRGSKNRSLQQRGGRRSKAIRQRRGDGAGSSKQGMALGAANGERETARRELSQWRKGASRRPQGRGLGSLPGFRWIEVFGRLWLMPYLALG